MSTIHLHAVLIVTAITLIIFLLVLWAKRQAGKSKGQMNDTLNKMIKELLLNISEQEVFHNKILALDSSRHFIIVHKADEITSNIIDLDNVIDCKVKKLTTQVSKLRKGEQIKTEEYIRKIQLSFLMKDRSETDVTIYSEIEDGMFELATLTAVAEKWQAKITKAMNVRFAGKDQR